MPLDDQTSLDDLCARIIQRLDPAPDREGLSETPARWAKALQFYTSGYGADIPSLMKVFSDGGERYDEMVFQGSIPIWSLCEHHLAPFFGVAHIGYIPGSRIVGLSKLSRLADVFSRRLQVQERITVQIADALEKYLSPRAVGVMLRCRHSCIEGRGVCKAGTVTYTSALRGHFLNEPEARQEFLKMVDLADRRESSL